MMIERTAFVIGFIVGVVQGILALPTLRIPRWLLRLSMPRRDARRLPIAKGMFLLASVAFVGMAHLTIALAFRQFAIGSPRSWPLGFLVGLAAYRIVPEFEKKVS